MSDASNLTILSTKFFPPTGRSSLVSRSHLNQKLQSAVNQQHRVILISAPAGYGKTTLVSNWLKENEQRFAWLSLDASDNDPHHFLAGLSAALNKTCPEIKLLTMEELTFDHLASLSPMLNDLVGELLQLPNPLLFVLDDYQVIRSQRVHEILKSLLQHPLPQLQLVLITREDPPLPLSRIRAQGLLTEIRTQDIQFSPEEAAKLLIEGLNLALTKEQAAALQSRTEGWVSGLHLAGLSLQGRTNPDKFIKNFTGSNSFILDYLLEEVLCQQPKEIQDFLFQTSILELMCADLCDCLLDHRENLSQNSLKPDVLDFGFSSSLEILEYLEQSNLFLVRLEKDTNAAGVQTWYRYHHLFADFLQSRLVRLHPDRLSNLHRNAAIWCESHGMEREAVHHALEAPDVNMAVRLIEKAALPLFLRGESATVLGWIQSLPAIQEITQSNISLLYAWALLNDGNLPGALLHLGEVEEDDLDPLYLILHALLQAQFHWFTEKPHEALYWAEKALQASHSPTNHALLDKFQFKIPAVLFATTVKAEAYRLYGQLQAAIKIYQEVLQSTLDISHGSRWQSMIANIKMKLGRLLYEQNKLQSAEKIVRQGITLASQANSQLFLLGGNVILAQIQLGRGLVKEAVKLVHEIEQMLTNGSNLSDVFYLTVFLAHFWTKVGDHKKASIYFESIQLAHTDILSRVIPDGMFDKQTCCLIMELLLIRGSTAEVQGLLDPMIAHARSTDQIDSLINLLVLQAWVNQAMGESKQALVKMQEVIPLAIPEGYVRVFVDKGPSLLPILRQLANAGPLAIADYARQILKAYSSPHGLSTQLVDSYVVQLSEREMEVLRLLSEGESNPEIAHRLYITVGTVKRHTSNIYTKLGVDNRTQAVVSAQTLGLL